MNDGPLSIVHGVVTLRMNFVNHDFLSKFENRIGTTTVYVLDLKSL